MESQTKNKTGIELKNAKKGVHLRRFTTKRLVLSFFLLLLLGGLTFLIIYYRSDLLVLVPGFYESKEYTDLAAAKNDLVNDNSLLLDQNDELETEAASQPLDAEGYEQKIALYDEIIANLTVIQQNLTKIQEDDDIFLLMRLPYSAARYVNLLHELDDIRANEISVSLQIVTARKYMALFNKGIIDFDACTAGIDFEQSPTGVSSSIMSCVGQVDDLKTLVADIEIQYGVTLDKTTNYLNLLDDQWTANSRYYDAIASHDNSAASEQDAIFADKLRQVNELDRVDVFNEFYEEKIGPLVDEFVALSNQESEKQSEANDWYDKNVKK